MLRIIPFLYYEDKDELLANTFLVYDEDKNCIIIDPSKNNEKIKLYILKNDFNLKAVCLTHGHFDHFSAAKILLDYFKCPLYIDFDDEPMLKDSSLNCSEYVVEPFTLEYKCENYPSDGKFNILNEEIQIIKTPYHTKGSVCFFLKESLQLISGDFLFRNCLGRCDLPNNAKRMLESSLNKVLSLPKEVKVYPGHGMFTTIEEERYTNHFVK